MNEFRDELRAGWRDLVGATIGLATGFACYFPITSLFLRALEHEFGWSKVQAAASLGGMSLAALALPVAGLLMDRFGVRRVALISALLIAGCFVWLSRIGPNLNAFYAAAAATAVLGCATTPIAYTRTIARRFVRSRGLALAIALIGVSGAGAVMPLVIGPVMAGAGWRAAYLVMAAIATAGGLVAYLLTRREPAAPGETQVQAAPEAGLSVVQAVSTPAFWMLGAAIFLITAATLGFVSQLQSIVIERGVPVSASALYVSVLSLSVCVSRLMTGWALDRFAPNRAAAAAIAVSALGLGVLVSGSGSVLLACILVGFGVGAELDLMTFFCARRFGLRRFGVIYGLLAVFYYLAPAVGGLVYARAKDLAGSYVQGFGIGAAALGVAALLFLMLGERRPKAA